jgi:hypothetical protein
MSEIREILSSIGLDGSVVFDNPDYDNAIIGFDYHSDRIIYDFDKMVEHLVEKYQMEPEEAIEFIDVNTVRSMSYMGDKAPIIFHSINDYL